MAIDALWITVLTGAGGTERVDRDEGRGNYNFKQNNPNCVKTSKVRCHSHDKVLIWKVLTF